jgi:hypothetical protein
MVHTDFVNDFIIRRIASACETKFLKKVVDIPNRDVMLEE